MLRTIYTPDSNTITFSIPDTYIGTALEINVFPTIEIFTNKRKTKKTTSRAPSLTARESGEVSDFQKFILSAPVMTDNQYSEFKQQRQQFKEWRVQ
ncbi:MAG: hypothetical protein LBU90_04745 [Bacteroidales bacterium]|jgi:hypothetical protein|nr:hypothetical protein [Bacteroidales bacterium]